MARKTKKRIKQLPAIKPVAIGLLAIGIIVVVGTGIVRVFRNADYFKVRSVVIDPSLQFINKRDLKNLMGKNIFAIDLKSTQRWLEYRYPQASRLKVMKHFPDQIAVIAKQRMPFLQIRVDGKTVIVDKEGVALFEQGGAGGGFPTVTGAKVSYEDMVRGLFFGGEDMQIALEIVRLFQADSGLFSYSISDINIGNLSKIYLALSNGLNVIVDREEIAQKIRVLSVILSKGELDLKRVEYIDLRFKEPVIGKK